MQGGQLTQEQIQQIPGFGPNASPPVFEKVFSNARFAQGGVAAFEGRITGKPQPTVSWTRKGAPLLNSQKHRLSYNETTGDVTLQVRNIFFRYHFIQVLIFFCIIMSNPPSMLSNHKEVLSRIQLWKISRFSIEHNRSLLFENFSKEVSLNPLP